MVRKEPLRLSEGGHTDHAQIGTGEHAVLSNIAIEGKGGGDEAHSYVFGIENVGASRHHLFGVQSTDCECMGDGRILVLGGQVRHMADRGPRQLRQNKLQT